MLSDPAFEHFAQALAALLDRSRAESPAVSSHARYVTIAYAAGLTGFSEKAIRRKIEDGAWLERREWRRAPDGHILIDMQGYEKWAERGQG